MFSVSTINCKPYYHVILSPVSSSTSDIAVYLKTDLSSSWLSTTNRDDERHYKLHFISYLHLDSCLQHGRKGQNLPSITITEEVGFTTALFTLGSFEPPCKTEQNTIVKCTTSSHVQKNMKNVTSIKLYQLTIL